MKNDTTTTLSPRDGANVSAWQEISPASLPNGIAAEHPQVYDCLVTGGGITGLTAALLLQEAGKQTIVAEAHGIGFGTTGGTSAHINTFADTNYSEAESAFGTEGARLFADAIADGFGTITQNIGKYQIDCDYESKPGYVYAETDEEVKQLAEIYEGAIKVGVAVRYTDEAPTPVPFKKALVFEGQAQFHPLKYLYALQKAFLAAGGTIAENTRINEITSEGGIHTAGDIRARNVIYATHMPPNINLFNFECAPYRSYVVAVTLNSGNYPDALVYDTKEPYHYVRSHVIEGRQLLLVGGADHKTGHDVPEKAFEDLESYVRKYYDAGPVAYRWSSQYYVPVDGLPYIGKMPLGKDGIYCATGYNGNGMMLGSVAGMILADMVSSKPNKYEKLFDPGRIKPIDGFSEFIKENADVAYRFVADRIGLHKADALAQLQPGTGEVLEVNGQKVAAYRDENSKIYALSPVCTHTGCIVNWNREEKSWDCPCHGARYDINGKVLTGPATKDLELFEENGK